MNKRAVLSWMGLILVFVLAVYAVTGFTGCKKKNEGDYETASTPTDYAWRQSRLTLHRVAGACVIIGVFPEINVAMVSIPCPPPEAP
jgi:hypothetical protein